MIKYNKLKQKMIKEGAIAAGAIFILSGLAFGITSYEESVAADLLNANNNVNALSSQITDIERKKNIISTSIKEYKDLRARLDKNEFTLDPISAQEKLNNIRKEFQLNEPKVEFKEEVELTSPAYQDYPSITATFREVNLTFKALTDLHVYSFLNALKTEFPGLIKVNEVQIKRLNRIDTNVIKGIVIAGQEPELIEANIKFLWIGLRLKDDQSMAGGNPNGT
jgi:hypothetical protein